MSELDEKLNSILSNPAMMQQIMALAQTLNQSDSQQQKPNPAPPPQQPAESPLNEPSLNPNLLSKVATLMQRGSIDKNQESLLKALRPYLSKQKLEDFKALLQREPRRFIAQEVIDFLDLPVMENGEQVMRKADLRAFVLAGQNTWVWPSGLTRFSREADSFVVNSSQGGGFKDTWVLSH